MSLTLNIQTYLDKGWSVIPVNKEKKCTLPSWAEFQTRKATPEEAKAFANSHGLALVTGKCSNVVIVDADNETGVKWCSENGLTSPLRVRTGRKDMAMHYYFTHPGVEVKSMTNLAPGVDIRADGGYAVLPPTIHESGRPYIWVNGMNVVPPVFPVERFPQLLRNQSGEVRDVLKPYSIQDSQRLKDVEQALKVLNPSRADNYDTWIRVGMALKEFGTVGLRLWAEWSKKSEKYEEAALLEKWPSFKDTGSLTIGTILSWARQDSGGTTVQDTVQQTVSPCSERLLEHKRRLFATAKSCEFPTGFSLLDQHVRLRKGEISTIAARTGIGKTSIAIKIACELCKQGKRVLFCTTEMSTDTIIERFVSILSGVSTAASRLGNYTSEEISRLDAGYEALSAFGERLQLFDKTSPNIDQVRQIAVQNQPEVVIFDHLQHIGGTGESRANISTFVRGLKDLARELDCPVLALSQIRRLGKDKNGKELEPSLSDLKESGTIEEESAHVTILSQLSGEDHDEKIVVVANVAKNRFGPKLRIGLEFNRPLVTFRDLELDNATAH